MHEHHNHEENSAHSREEAVALLKYMIDHNRHHADELHEIAHSLGGDAQAVIHDACVDFDIGNDKLCKALELLKGE